MASKAFLLLALAFAVVLFITSEVAAAKELASDHNSEINESGRGGYNKAGDRGGNEHIGRRGDKDVGGHDHVGGRTLNPGHKCKGGRCCRGHGKGCGTSSEATASKQIQN